ncbi:MAG: site-specific DNA-methyltransferase [Pseudomonadota bacterium]|nr:site-specific DNA-methyltransferase [Pseudomonadota bacterium]
MAKQKPKKTVEVLTHEESTRKNIPTAEYQSVMQKEEQSPVRVAYERRNRDLDPQLVWRGKDEQDWSDLVVPAPPLYIQEKVHPKVLIDELLRRSELARAEKAATKPGFQPDLFADFNGLPDEARSTEFYQHDANWSNRMILGDSLQVMASLAEREGLRGQVQCIYIDPPYGIKFNSNFQWSTTSRDVKDGNADHITREPEQVKAFRDTWREGVHSYLTYLRDRLTVARDLLSESGSIFVQIGDENVHRVRALMDEVFGEDNFCAVINFKKTGGQSASIVASVFDVILWYAKNKTQVKYRPLYYPKLPGEEGATNFDWIEEERFARRKLGKREFEDLRIRGTGERIVLQPYPLFSDGKSEGDRPYEWRGSAYKPSASSHWKTTALGIRRLDQADRLLAQGKTLRFVNFLNDYPVTPIVNVWYDTQISGYNEKRVYVVQTLPLVVDRCVLMTTDPSDLVLDPTCGSGTTAYVAEQRGRRWITIDTSRVALALARARLMGARYLYYLLADSRNGQLKDAEIRRIEPSEVPTREDIQQGFVYERVQHVTLGSIAHNAEIDVIWEKFQQTLEPLRKQLNVTLGRTTSRHAREGGHPESPKLVSRVRGNDGLLAWEEWEIPRDAEDGWPAEAKELHAQWWQQRIARQKEIDASIAAKAEYEYLYDKPYEDNKKVRVAGPFTVESLSPHRVLGVDENDELIDSLAESKAGYREKQDFPTMILENLKTAGVQQAHKDDKIVFSSITPWPGDLVCAEGRYIEGDEETGTEKRAAVFIGPEFGTVSRPDLVAAAREAGDADFNVLVACAFNYDARSTEFDKLGRIPVLKARMNADLHMADDLKNTGKGNLFVIFGEPDIDILPADDGQIRVKINGVDVFHPNTGEVRSDGPDGIACWFIDTDYNEESFFVRHAYFLGANDPYKSLKITLKAEINEEAWETLHSDTSRPFDKPKSRRIAVKVINHLGDEVMKVFKVD